MATRSVHSTPAVAPLRKYAVLTTLLAFEVLLAAMSALFFWRMRPALLADYADAAGRIAALGLGSAEMSPYVRLSLSGWFVPSAVAAGSAFCLVGASPWVRRKTGLALVGTGLVVTAFVLTFALWTSYAPAFAGPE